MKENISFLLFCFTSLFTIVNPLGSIPIFNSIAADMPKADKLYIAKRVAIISCLAMMGFAIGGQFVFSFFNISINGLKVVSGVLLFLVGYEMLQGQAVKSKSITVKERDQLDEMAITPLAIPLVCGPGAISVSILLFEQSTTEVKKGLLFASILLVSLSTFLCFAAGQSIQKYMGASANKVFTKIMGLIIMMISVEFFFSGLKPYIHILMDPDTTGFLLEIPKHLSKK